MKKKMRQGPQLGHHGKRAGGRRQGPEQGRQAEGCRQDSGGRWQEVHGSGVEGGYRDPEISSWVAEQMLGEGTVAQLESDGEV